MKLRDYQLAAVEAVLRTWKTARSCLIVLPTGCGKTVVFGEIIRRALGSGRAMVLAHREELISQAEQKVAAITLPLRNEKRKAELKVIRLGLKDSRLRIVRERLNISGTRFQTILSSLRCHFEPSFRALRAWRS